VPIIAAAASQGLVLAVGAGLLTVLGLLMAAVYRQVDGLSTHIDTMGVDLSKRIDTMGVEAREFRTEMRTSMESLRSEVRES
jgi:hypothetical protein